MSNTNQGCRGKECGTLVGDHSPECILEAAKTQGWLDAPEAMESAIIVAAKRLNPQPEEK